MLQNRLSLSIQAVSRQYRCIGMYALFADSVSAPFLFQMQFQKSSALYTVPYSRKCLPMHISISCRIGNDAAWDNISTRIHIQCIKERRTDLDLFRFVLIDALLLTG